MSLILGDTVYITNASRMSANMDKDTPLRFFVSHVKFMNESCHVFKAIQCTDMIVSPMTHRYLHRVSPRISDMAHS